MICAMSRFENKLTQAQLDAFHKYSSILALGFIAVVIASLFWRLMMPRMDFYNELWGPAYLLVQGKSPYDTASLNPILPAVWFPMAIGFFFPLGWLPETLHCRYGLFSTSLKFARLFILFREISAPSTIRQHWRCFAFSFLSFSTTFNLGQFSITVMLCLLLSAYFAEKHRTGYRRFFSRLGLPNRSWEFWQCLG